MQSITVDKIINVDKITAGTLDGYESAVRLSWISRKVGALKYCWFILRRA